MCDANNAANMALQLDPNLAEAHAALGSIKLWLYRDWPGAQTDFERALALNPDAALPHSRYAMVLAMRGRIADALAGIKRAQELEPASPTIASDYGRYLLEFCRN